tara:strand:- start:184 stop:450 length:267 start_codon:yes stop_codon:yes gene_type:complete
MKIDDKKKEIVTKSEMRQVESFIKNANKMLSRMAEIQLQLEKHAEIIDDYLYEEQPEQEILVKIPKDLVEYIQSKVADNGNNFIFGIS